MLKVQLCPESELENPYWWVSDVGVLLCVAFISWMVANLVLEQLQKETVRLNEAKDRWTKEEVSLQPMVTKFKGLESDVKLLTRKIEALKKISVSRLDKVRPMVGLEQLQTLRPEGLWYQELGWLDDGSVQIKAASRDSLLISEYLLSLRETMNADTWSQDVRTMTGFQDIKLDSVKLLPDSNFADLGRVLTFSLVAKAAVKTKPANVGPSAASPMIHAGESVQF